MSEMAGIAPTAGGQYRELRFRFLPTMETIQLTERQIGFPSLRREGQKL